MHHRADSVIGSIVRVTVPVRVRIASDFDSMIYPMWYGYSPREGANCIKYDSTEFVTENSYSPREGANCICYTKGEEYNVFMLQSP